MARRGMGGGYCDRPLRPRILSGPSCLRYRVTARFKGRDVKEVARCISKETEWASGVYVLVRCSAALSDRQVVRAALRLEAEILYVGLSEKDWHVRVGTLGHGLWGGALSHDAARWVARTPSIHLSELRLILISFSPAFSLEDFLIEEHARHTGRFPTFNFTWGGRSFPNIGKVGIKGLTWAKLLSFRKLRRSLEGEASAVAQAMEIFEAKVARMKETEG